MKKQFSILTVAMALLMGVTSCSKDNESAPTGEGTLKVNFNFKTVTPTRAATSAAKPDTKWANVKNLQLVLVDGGGIAKVVRDVTIPASGAAVTPEQTFDRIPIGSYKIYLIANNNYVGNPFGGATAKIGTASPIVVGTNFNSALMNLITALPSSFLGTAPAGGAYDEASELFIGYGETGTIEADKVNPTPVNVELARAVSLLRIRIDQTDVVSKANTVDFTSAANTSIRLRRHAKALKILNAPVSQFGTPKEGHAFTSTKPFKNAAPGSGYTGDMGLGADFTLWNDYVILPGGHGSAGADKFNLLISGHAPEGYINSEGGIVAAGGARVWWQGDVDGLIASNGILVLNVKVATPGFEGENPPPFETYGKLSITASLIDWAPATNVNVPL